VFYTGAFFCGDDSNKTAGYPVNLLNKLLQNFEKLQFLLHHLHLISTISK